MEVKPDKVDFIRPNETAIFIVNITPPKDAPDTDIIIGVSAAADQVLSKKDSNFKVLSLQDGGAQTTSSSSSGQVGIGDFGSLEFFGINIYVIIGVAAAAAVMVFVVLRSMREEGRWSGLYNKWSGSDKESRNTEKLRVMRGQIRE
jgi:hypothetical protein